MTLIAEHPYNQYGSAIFANNSALIISTADRSNHNCEILTIETKNFYITSVYKPPNEQLICSDLTPTNSNKPHIFIGDFN